ncbi:MAG TPA: DUF2127 domain-containing protein [Burkholderiales bacterium]|nr:DUF2127 domain-containing protein [Burkholderiales bacterium]
MRHEGVRLVAAVEGAKGALVLAMGVGLHRLAHHDVRAFAVHLLHQFHLNPASHYPSIFLHAMEHMSDARLQMLALGAAAYASLRFVEAYGLWRERRWAEWLAAVSGGLYIPFELYHLWLSVTPVKLGLLGVNVVIVAYMVWLLWTGRRERKVQAGG